ncbi:hypothetical protein RDI58_014826 [Solanum bulbocastanum]|uniref:Uncharacterized protein n=1 Tax=Solanum bulbocastanum TaxID=147425 RepID=A0AAN8TIZ5_SOLBU
MQEQVQPNVAATQTPHLDPRSGSHSVAATGEPKVLKNFIYFKPPEFDVTPASIKPQKFIDRCKKILTTFGLKETRGVEFTTFLFLGVFYSALCCESYLEMEKFERESKKACNAGGFCGAPFGGNSGFHHGQSRPNKSDSVVQSSRRDHQAKQGHIAKFSPKGESGTGQATSQVQRNVVGHKCIFSQLGPLHKVFVDKVLRVHMSLKEQVDHRDYLLWPDKISRQLMS